MLVLEKGKLNDFLQALGEQRQVLVPVDYFGLSQYAPYQDGMDILLDAKTTIPPKSVYLPQSEAIYRFKAQGKKLAITETEDDASEKVLMFVRHCDVQGIACLDKVFITPEFTDQQYASRREHTTVFALRCNESKDTCFCTSMGVDPVRANDTVADVEVYDLGERFAFESLTEKGDAVLKEVQAMLSEQSDVALPPVKERKLQLKTDGLPEKLSGMFDDAIWNDFMFKCLGCGTCTYICPTCHCFDLNNKIRGEVGLKLRTWDSCMFDEYTLMAGGHQPRAGKKERIRNRFLHKLEYFYENHQMFLCVGCGRCLNKCPMNIDITKFIAKVMEEESR